MPTLFAVDHAGLPPQGGQGAHAAQAAQTRQARFVGLGMSPVPLGQTGLTAYYKTPAGVPIVDVSGMFSFTGHPYFCCNIPAMCQSVRQAADEPGDEMGLEFQSSGGDVLGLSDIAAAIAYARTKKTVTAIVHEMALSMAAATALMCDRVVITASGQMGSLGVMATLIDTSKMDEENGIRRVVVCEPEGKAASAGGTITPEMEQAHREQARQYYLLMCDLVAPTSGLSRDDITALNAQRFIGPEAVGRGLADQVVDYETFIAAMGTASTSGASGIGSPLRKKDEYSEDRLSAGAPKTATSQVNPVPAASAAGSAPSQKGSTMTEAELREKFPDLYQSITGKAATEARQLAQSEPATLEQLLADFKGKGSDGMAFVAEAMEQKLTLPKAHSAWAARVEKNAAAAVAAAAAAAKVAGLPQGSGTVVTENPAANPGTDPQCPFPTFEAGVRTLMKDEVMTRPEATRELMKRFPKLHAAMLKGHTFEKTFEPAPRLNAVG